MRLKYNQSRPVDYPEDCARICGVLGKAGFTVTLHEAEIMWQEYSDSCCASWLFLPDSDSAILDALTD